MDLTAQLGAAPEPLPAIRGGRGGGTREQYIPENTNEETKLDVQAVTGAVLDSYSTRIAEEGREGYPVLSKYDFASELLTLIHVSFGMSLLDWTRGGD